MLARTQMFPLRSWALTLLGAALLGGCGVNYAPPSLVNKLRILGIRAEPAYVPAAGATVLDPLTAGQPVGAKLCYSWAFCPFAWAKDGAFRCIDPALQVDLGSGVTATLSTDVVMTSLAAAPAVFKKLGMAQPGGSAPASTATSALNRPEFYVLLKVATAEVTGGTCPTDTAAALGQPCADSRNCLVGYKRLAWAIDPKKINKNPTIQGLLLDAVEWPADLTPTAAPGDRISLVPKWDPADKEVIGKSVDPAIGNDIETLLFSWFTTTGVYDKERSYDAVPGNVLALPSLHAGETERLMTLWLVERDGRNGEDWTSRQIVVRQGVSGNVHPLCAADPTLKGCDHLDAHGQVISAP